MVTQQDRDFVADLRRVFLADPKALEHFLAVNPFEFRDGSKDEHWLIKRAMHHRTGPDATQFDKETKHG